jgi:hypothetical protein
MPQFFEVFLKENFREIQLRQLGIVILTHDRDGPSVLQGAAGDVGVRASARDPLPVVVLAWVCTGANIDFKERSSPDLFN